MNVKKTLCAAMVAALAASNALAAPFGTTADAMMVGLNGATTKVLLTVGETFAEGTANAYTPVGIIDGLGAYSLDANTVRVLANHELRHTQGALYALANGTSLAGARVSYFDIDKNTRRIVGAGAAYSTIYDRAGVEVTSASQLDFGGFNRFCSSALTEANQFGGNNGFVDRIYLSGEERGGGSMWAVDTDTHEIWGVPAMGRGGRENATQIDTGNENTVGILLGDDRQGAPLYLYVGNKDRGAAAGFLARNGLAEGRLYVWAADTATSPTDFNGTGSTESGTWKEVNNFDPSKAGTAGWDAMGYADQDTLDDLADAAGHFAMSRPEDVATDPNDGGRAVIASTGRDSLFPADSWGTIYTVDIEFDGNGQPTTAALQILYDGDDAGNQDDGLRSPDNLDWADDGSILVQEDRSIGGFGQTSGEEASIWRFASGAAGIDPVRIAQMNRHAVPAGQTDPVPGDIGNWESSGILDVSTLFGERAGTLFLFDVQAHSLTDGIIDTAGLVQGGQLLFLDTSELPTP